MNYRLGIAFLIVGAAIGFWAGYAIYRPAPVTEAYAPPVRQGDGSLVLERKPDANAKPAQAIPTGSTVERIIHAVIQPRPENLLLQDAPKEPGPSTSIPGPGNSENPSQENPCPPVQVDLTLVRMPDGTHRAIVSSPDGTVLTGADIPVEAAKPEPKTLKWGISAVWNPGERTYGARLDRDLGPFRVSGEAMQIREAITQRITWTGTVSVGIRF